MNCEETRQKIRLFLDDLLEERVYQDVHRHLDQCSPCHLYASTVGGFSYQLRELGQVNVPPDIFSTLSYTLGQTPIAAHPGPAAAEISAIASTPPPRTSFNFFWVLAGIIFFITSIAIGYILWVQHRPVEILSNQTSQNSVTIPKTIHSSAIDAVNAGGSNVLEHLHRHFHLYSVTGQELSELLDTMGFEALFRSSKLVVLDVSGDRYLELMNRLEVMSGVIKEFNEEAPPRPGQIVSVSIFLE